MSLKIKLPIVKCGVCQYEWTPRGCEVRYCPNCVRGDMLSLVQGELQPEEDQQP